MGDADQWRVPGEHAHAGSGHGGAVGGTAGGGRAKPARGLPDRDKTVSDGEGAGRAGERVRRETQATDAIWTFPFRGIQTDGGWNERG